MYFNVSLQCRDCTCCVCRVHVCSVCVLMFGGVALIIIL